MLSPAGAVAAEQGMNQPSAINGFENPNPHMKYFNASDHGYYVLDLTEEKAQADYYFIDILDTNSDVETFGEGWFSNSLDNRLNQADSEAPEKQEQPDLAPQDVPEFGNLSIDEFKASNLAVFSLYPNPLSTSDVLYIQYGLVEPASLKIRIYDLNGKLISNLFNEDVQNGIFFKGFNLPQLAQGNYILTISNDANTISKGIIIK